MESIGFQSWGELSGQLVVGALIGFLSGYLLRKVSRIVGILVLLAAVVGYYFVWKGFLVIDWGALADRGKTVAEKIAESRPATAVRGMNWKEMLANNLPFSCALVAGGIFGFLKGH